MELVWSSCWQISSGPLSVHCSCRCTSRTRGGQASERQWRKHHTRATSVELGGATWFGDTGSSLIDCVWAPTALPLRCSGPLRKLAAELQLIDTRKLRDHVPLGLEFDYVQLAVQPAPGEKEGMEHRCSHGRCESGCWKGRLLGSFGGQGEGRGDAVGAAPTASLPRPVGRLPQQSFGRDGAAILQERTDGCARLCRLDSEKAGASQAANHYRSPNPGKGKLHLMGPQRVTSATASQESAGGQEGHWRGSSPGAGRLGKFGGAPAEGPSSRGTVGAYISSSQGIPMSPLAKKTVLQ